MSPKSLDRVTIKELIDLLSPFCDSPTKRRALFTSALGVHPVLNGLDYEDDALTFIPNAVHQLHNFGEIEDGKTALWLVLEEVRGRVGLDKQKWITILQASVNAGIGKTPSSQQTTLKTQQGSAKQREIARLLTQVEDLEKKEVWDFVIELCKEILKIDKYHDVTREKASHAYFQRSLKYDYKTDYDRVIADLTQAIELSRLADEFYYMRGRAYWWKREFDKSIADVTRAIQLNSSNPEYFRGRGVSYYEKDEYDDAIADFDRAVQLEPDNPSYYYLRGVSYQSKAKHGLAIADFERAIQLDSNKAVYYYRRALSNRWMNNPAAVRSDLQLASDMGYEPAKEALERPLTARPPISPGVKGEIGDEE